MAAVSVYLYFTDQTEAAFTFYKGVFGTEFVSPPMRYGDMMGDDPNASGLPESARTLIANVQLPILGGHLLMGSDAPAEFGTPVVTGNNVQICLLPDTRDEADTLFAALADGGTIERPLEDAVWGGYYGEVEDRFGIKWIINQTPTA